MQQQAFGYNGKPSGTSLIFVPPKNSSKELIWTWNTTFQRSTTCRESFHIQDSLLNKKIVFTIHLVGGRNWRGKCHPHNWKCNL